MFNVELQKAIDAAIETRTELDARLRDIERMFGKDIDDLEEILCTCDADSLIEHVREVTA